MAKTKIYQFSEWALSKCKSATEEEEINKLKNEDDLEEKRPDAELVTDLKRKLIYRMNTILDKEYGAKGEKKPRVKEQNQNEEEAGKNSGEKEQNQNEEEAGKNSGEKEQIQEEKAKKKPRKKYSKSFSKLEWNYVRIDSMEKIYEILGKPKEIEQEMIEKYNLSEDWDRATEELNEILSETTETERKLKEKYKSLKNYDKAIEDLTEKKDPISIERLNSKKGKRENCLKEIEKLEKKEKLEKLEKQDDPILRTYIERFESISSNDIKVFEFLLDDKKFNMLKDKRINGKNMKVRKKFVDLLYNVQENPDWELNEEYINTLYLSLVYPGVLEYMRALECLQMHKKYISTKFEEECNLMKEKMSTYIKKP